MCPRSTPRFSRVVHQIVASISDRGTQQSASTANLFYCKEDNRNTRVINSAIVATPGCTSGEWSFNPVLPPVLPQA
eukprot:752753-Hanusia_phi.AAC.6